MPGETPRNPEEPASQDELQIAKDAVENFLGSDAAQDRTKVEEVADLDAKLQQAFQAKRDRDGQ